MVQSHGIQWSERSYAHARIAFPGRCASLTCPGVHSSCECRGENRSSAPRLPCLGMFVTASRVQEPGDQVVVCNPYIEVGLCHFPSILHFQYTFASTLQANTPQQTWLENNYATMARRSSSQALAEDWEGHTHSSSPHEEPMSWSTTWAAPSRVRVAAAR